MKPGLLLLRGCAREIAEGIENKPSNTAETGGQPCLIINECVMPVTKRARSWEESSMSFCFIYAIRKKAWLMSLRKSWSSIGILLKQCRRVLYPDWWRSI